MRRLEAIAAAVLRACRAVAPRAAWMHRWYLPLTAAGLTTVAVVALFRMESSTADYDPQFMRVLVERKIRFGGSYYSNGIHNKGPLEPILHEIAGRLGGRDGWWFVMAAMTLVAAVLVGFGAAVVAVRSGASALLGSAVATMAVVHLTLSQADYAGVLYARNITTALLALAVGLAAFDGIWESERGCRWAVALIGVAVGLSAQTLLTAAITAGPILLWAVWERRRTRLGRLPAWPLMILVAAVSFATAPLWYLLVGPRQDFVDGYWTYARFMSEATGRSLASQFTLGGETFIDYYNERPELVVVFVAWLVAIVLHRRNPVPGVGRLHALVAVWWLGAWVELALSQRYSSHYFSVLAVPTIMMIALVVGAAAPWLERLLRWRSAALLPLLVAAVTIAVGGRVGFDAGLESAATFRDTSEFTERRDVGLDGRTHVVRAALELVSRDSDPILMWTNQPWPYLQLERTSATRYIWKSFLVGEIYLASTSPDYVLPGTWDHFRQDLERSSPAAYLVENAVPIDPDTPFREVVDEQFADVLVDDAVTLGFRREVADWLTAPPAAGTPVLGLSDAALALSPDGCVRLDARISATTTPVLLDAVGPDGGPAQIVVTAGPEGTLVDSLPSGVAPWGSAAPSGDGSPVLTVVAGERSLVVLVDGRITGAVEIRPGTAVSVSSGVTQLAEVTLSVPLEATGCGI